VGDGHIDCIGARDERNVLPCPVDHRIVGDRFLCDNKMKCIDHSAIFNGIKDCMDETDESICYWNVGKCSTGEFSCADGKGCKSSRCNTKVTCNDKSHRFWCPNASDCNGLFLSVLPTFTLFNNRLIISALLRDLTLHFMERCRQRATGT
jgi:hypothetical protein